MNRISPNAVSGESVRSALRGLSLAATTGLAVYLCWSMTTPFLGAFTWAFALTVAFSPVHGWLSVRLPKTVATLLVILAVIIAISLPGAFVSHELFQESLKAQQLLKDSIKSDYWQNALLGRPWLAVVFTWVDNQLDLGQIGQEIAGVMARAIAPAVAGSVRMVAQAGVTLLALFFFLQDKEIGLASVRSLLPFHDDEIDRVFARISSTVRATVYGRLLIGLIQGLLGGVIFAIVGLPAPVFWGAVMMLLSLLPVFGAFVVWAPASVILFAQGHWIRAVVVLVWGLAVIHPIDNLLYPVLVGSRIGLHPLVLFIAFVGGLVAFGPAGLILGPCVIAFALGLAEVLQSRGAGTPHPAIYLNDREQ